MCRTSGLSIVSFHTNPLQYKMAPNANCASPLPLSPITAPPHIDKSVLCHQTKQGPENGHLEELVLSDVPRCFW